MGVLQCLLRLFALGDVADGARYEHALFGLQRAQTDLHRKLEAVLAQSIQLQPGAHRAKPGLGEVLRAVSGMLAAKPQRQQHFHRPLEQLRARVAEQPLGLRIDQHNVAFVIHDHFGVRRRLEQPPEFLFRRFAFGDVRVQRAVRLFQLQGALAHPQLKLIALFAQLLQAAAAFPDHRAQHQTHRHQNVDEHQQQQQRGAG